MMNGEKWIENFIFYEQYKCDDIYYVMKYHNCKYVMWCWQKIWEWHTNVNRKYAWYKMYVNDINNVNAKYVNDIKCECKTWKWHKNVNEIYDDWLINVNKKYVMNKWYCDNQIVMFYVRYAAGLLSENSGSQQSSRYALVLRPKTSKTLCRPVNFPVFI
jgi:hypothetical protein